MRICFKRTDNGDTGEWELDKEAFILGRSPECHAVLNDEQSQGVSSQHSQLTVSGGEVFLEDLQSTNGTLVNGIQISEKTRVNVGDWFSCGTSGPRFSIERCDASISKHLQEEGVKAFEFRRAEQEPNSGVENTEDGTSQRDTIAIKGLVGQEGNRKARPATRELLVQAMRSQSIRWRVAFALLSILGISFVSLFVLLPNQGADSNLAYQRLTQCALWVVPREGSGSGVIVSYRGRQFGLTNWHVVKDSKDVLVFFPEYRDGKLVDEIGDILASKKHIPAHVLLATQTKDVAIMELETVPSECVPLNLSEKSVEAGNTIYTLGNPGATETTKWIFGEGKVRSVGHREREIGDHQGRLSHVIKGNLIISQLPSNAGDSGGPIMNEEFKLVGLNAAGNQAASLISTGIDISEIRILLDQVIDNP